MILQTVTLKKIKNTLDIPEAFKNIIDDVDIRRLLQNNLYPQINAFINNTLGTKYTDAISQEYWLVSDPLIEQDINDYMYRNIKFGILAVYNKEKEQN